MHVTVHAVNRPEVPTIRMPLRFRHDVTYFVTHPTDCNKPALPPGEYYLRLDEAATALEDGVFRIVSPLDSDNRTELEITEEQEDWLAWVVKHGVEQIRLVSQS